MIYLVTGQPGHGKTLRAVEMALEYRAKGRAVYAHGVRGLNYEAAGFLPLEDPSKWQELPDSSVILLDECYTHFPKGGGTAKVADYIQALATHRHRGFDIIFVCQQASKQLHPFIQGLVDWHYHIRRKWGTKNSIILAWDRYSPNVGNSDSKRLWRFPRSLMKRNLYESTVEDTTQRRFPLWLFAGIAVIAVLVFLVSRATGYWESKGDKSKVVASPASLSSSFVGGSSGAAVARPDDLAKWLKPRLAGQPWTAPAYDGRQVASEPEVYCIAVEDGRCNCVTEQGTKYVVEPKICRSIAADGVYNPTRAPRQDGQQAHSRSSESRPLASESGGPTEGQWPAGVGKQSYTAPGTPGSWKSDPFGGGAVR